MLNNKRFWKYIKPNGINENPRLPKNTKCFPFSTLVNKRTIPDIKTYNKDNTLNNVKKKKKSQ